jgi:hypothetical protein
MINFYALKFYWELILSLPNGDLELYYHILVLLLSHCNLYHLINVDGKITVIKYYDEISWSVDSNFTQRWCGIKTSPMFLDIIILSTDQHWWWDYCGCASHIISCWWWF